MRNTRIIVLLSVLLLVACMTASGQRVQPDADRNAMLRDSIAVSLPPITWYSPLANIPRQWGRWWEYAFRPEMVNDWLIVGGLTAGLVVTDDLTYTPSDKFYRSSPAAKRWSDFMAGIGDGTTQFILAGSFAAYGLLNSDDRALRTGTQIFEVVLSSGALIQVLKHITGRESPFVRSTPTGVWKFFPSQIDYHRFVPYHDAFPSGHLCTSVATVVVISENYPDNPWIEPVGYALSALVAIGMGNNGIHWYSDYPLGAFIGYTMGMVAAHPEGFAHELPSPSSRHQLSLSPIIMRDGGGLLLTLRFN